MEIKRRSQFILKNFTYPNLQDVQFQRTISFFEKIKLRLYVVLVRLRGIVNLSTSKYNSIGTKRRTNTFNKHNILWRCQIKWARIIILVKIQTLIFHKSWKIIWLEFTFRCVNWDDYFDTQFLRGNNIQTLYCLFSH